MPHRSPRLAALALFSVGTFAVLRAATAAPPPPPPIAYHPNLAAAQKEAKTLHVPVLVVLTKAKASVALDPRVARMAQKFAAVALTATPALTKQFELDDDTTAFVLNADGDVVEKFAEAVTPEKQVAALKAHVATARGKLLDDLKPESDAKEKKAALAGLAKLGHRAEDLIPLLIDADVATRDTAKKALAALPPDEAMDPLLAALKSDDAKLRTAVHPLAVTATGYKQSPLKVWPTGTDAERSAAWDKWNEAVQAQHPTLNRAVLAFCEFSMGAQVNNGECAMLVVDAYKEHKAKPMRRSGETYIWGRELKPDEVLPGDVIQFEKVKTANGSAPHHTSVVRKVLGPGKFETLEQNTNGVKKVQPGKLDLSTVKEGSIVFYRPEPR